MSGSAQQDAVLRGIARERRHVFDGHDGHSLCSRALRARPLRHRRTQWRTNLRRQRAILQSPFMQMCSHYLVIRLPVRQVAPCWENGQVENRFGLSVNASSRRGCGSKPSDEFNAWLLEKCIASHTAPPGSGNWPNRR